MISSDASSTQRPIAPQASESRYLAEDGLLHALSLARHATELDSQAQYHLALDAYKNAIGSIYQVLLAAVGSPTDLDEVGRRRLEAIVGSYEDRVLVLRKILQ